MNRQWNVFFAAFFLVCFAATSFAQDSVGRSDDLYSAALKASILQMEKEWGHFSSGLDNESPTDYRRMIVRQNPSITKDLPSNFEGHAVEYLTDEELVARYRKIRKSFAVLEIGPMHNEGADLKIVVTTYWFSYKHGRRELAYSDWSEVRFHYDPAKEQFVLASVKLGGI